MKRLPVTLASALLALGIAASPASAEFGLGKVGFAFKDDLGFASLQAGSHPFSVDTEIAMNISVTVKGKGLCTHPLCEFPDGQVEDFQIDLPEGFVGNPRALPRCTANDFIKALCPDSTVMGIQALKFSFEPIPFESDEFLHVPIYNLVPAPGVAARIGFYALGVPVTADFGVNPNPPYNLQAHVTNIAQTGIFISSLTTVWGDPGAPAHDPLRGDCLDGAPSPLAEPKSLGECPLDTGQRTAFLTLPRSCTGPVGADFFARAWNTGITDEASALVEPGMTGCSKLDFNAAISSRATTDHASSPSGLDFNLQIDDPGILNPEGIALSDIKKAVVTLPEGVTINPSQAEGLAVCTEAQLAKETASSPFGAGCPGASKIGTVEVETPLLEGEVFKGSVFVAEPFANRFGSLLAIYMTIKHPGLGVGVRLAGRVEPHPKTGRLITTFGEAGHELPQLPFSDFRLHFREGGRSPLITPERCGTYTTEAVFTPWANPQAPLEATSSFQIASGVGGAPCPPPGAPPFLPGFSAGTLANDAAAFSPFYMRLTRRDGDQDMTKFSTVPPPGLLGKLAGVEKCPEAAIAAAKAKTGRAELASPSCPPGSLIGRTNAGAGVGSQLTYVPGKLYLAGPVGKSPLSVVSITPAVAGPFDVGTVVVRVALTVNPVTGEVEVDGASSDPIPHILAGIPLKVRDLRVYVDRPDFILNPTNCDPMQSRATLYGSFLDVFNPADDVPVSLSSHFQAANCGNLGFRPRLSFRLKGGTKRGANPAFRAVLRPRPGDANLRRTVVRFPRATFLDQGHIRTICTRVQFAADSCPPGSVYGKVKAFTPLLDDPLEGPVYLRSSDNLLPDLVFDLKGLVDIEAAARADSVKGKLRVTFPAIPDAPVSRVVVKMQGGKKGLLVNSRDICAGKRPRAWVRMVAHNGRRQTTRPALRAKGCAKARKSQKRRRGGHRRQAALHRFGACAKRCARAMPRPDLQG